MKIALAQMEVIPNRPDKNLETMIRMIEEAKQKKVDLIAFPEMCIGGYLLGDMWLNDDFCKDLMEYNEEIRKASSGIAIAFGNIFLDEHINDRVKDSALHPNKDGRIRRYNAVYVVQNQEYVERARETKILPKGAEPKTLLPNYRIFDDERYFFSLEDIAKDFNVGLESLKQPFLIELNGKKVPIGFELCEDLWCEDYRRKGKAQNPTKMLIDNGADLMVNLSASPWTHGKNSARDRRVQFLKQESGNGFVPFLYVNCIGVQNNGKNLVTFDGGSTAYNADGKPIMLSKEAYKEELMIIGCFDAKEVERKEEPKIAQKYKAIVEGIRHVKDLFGREEHPRHVIGLSGGIDSAVVAALLTQAVGRENVCAVNMPTKYNSEKTKQTAERVAESLGIAYMQLPIEEIVKLNEALLENIEADGKAKLSTLNKENIQAKIRGTSILSNLASKYGALFTCNGNKLEIAVGYVTLYGDVGGAYAPIGDLTKAEIVELAKYINKEVFKKEVIPEILIPDDLFRFRKEQIQPSAELEYNQVDPMKFGYHCALLEAFTDYKKKTPEDALRWYIAGVLEKNLGISAEMIKRYGVDDPRKFVEDMEWLVSGIQKNVFKRIQSPPIILTSKSAYGYDIRESMIPFRQTKEYDRLREHILGMKKYQTSGE
ncbi:NAD(+) synthase [Candidatus Woesearchaeota archaeon]|nr:NAD(+) synthase [Candidatus Woesearchaeota archaeon]